MALTIAQHSAVMHATAAAPGPKLPGTAPDPGGASLFPGPGSSAAEIVAYGEPKDAPTQTVYLAATWDAEWEEEENLFCTESVESVLPHMPTATFTWLYGYVELPDETTFYFIDKFLSRQRWYVKVVWSFTDVLGEAKTRTWVGVIENVSDQLGGYYDDGVDLHVCGEATITAYGIERVLDVSSIRLAYWIDPDGATVQETEILPDFNARGLPDRTEAKTDDSYLFEPDRTKAKYWSTIDIIEYLLKRCAPDAFTFYLGTCRGLRERDWDKPTVEQHGRTVYNIIGDLVGPSRMMFGWFEWQSDETIKLDTNALTPWPISVDVVGAPSVPANNRKFVWAAEKDPFTRLSLKSSDVGVYDRVIVRGAMIRAVGTFSIVDGTLETAWNTDLETEYDAAASNEADYADCSLGEKRLANEEARRNPKFRDVYALHRIPADWDGEVLDGENGSGDPLAAWTSLFQEPRDGDGDVKAFPGESPIEPDLPLLVGVDYGDTNIANDDLHDDLSDIPDPRYSEPLVFVKRKSQTALGVDRWSPVAESATAGAGVPDTTDGEAPAWSARVEVIPHTRSFRLVVDGQTQQCLYGDRFSSGALDADVDYGDLDPENGEMLATLSISTGRYLQGVWPAEDPDEDVIRIKTIDLGDRFSAFYVAPSTVVGIETDGSLRRSTGGWVPRLMPDDSWMLLRALAKCYHGYYSLTRRILDAETAWFYGTDRLRLGDMCTFVGTEESGHRQTVMSCVSTIRIGSPIGSGDNRPTPKLSVTTWAGDLQGLRPDQWLPEAFRKVRRRPFRARAGRGGAPVVSDKSRGRKRK